MEQENDVDVTDVTDVSESDVTETEDSSDEITWEQAMEWKKKAERLEKAEKKLVELKKAQKIEKVSNPSSLDQNEVKKILKEEKFYDSNPDFVEYKEEISKYVSKGLDIEEAALLVKERDESFKNKAKQKEMSITGWEALSSKTSFSIAELEKMSQSEYNKAMARIDKWEATIR